MSPAEPPFASESAIPAASWDVFVAYSTPDRETAKRIAESLKPYLRVFIDIDEVQIGDHWDTSIRDAMLSSSVVLAIISQNTDKAFYERDEILRAIDRMRHAPNTNFVVPVFVNGLSPSAPDVPYGLKPLQGVSLSTEEDLEALGRKLIGRIAELRPLAVEAAHFTSSIRNRFEQISQEVVNLTAEQYRVIQQLRHLRRVRISGCAGSGKTLVAAEKCARLSASTQKVLFLCHNPLLAEFVRTLIPNSGTEVYDFSGWVGMYTDKLPHFQQTDWSHFEEPTQDQLDAFLTQLQSQDTQFDAIVVDEAQDFREEWWSVVEAALSHGSQATLYIFHDNNQSLLPHRGSYPIKEPQIDLSRNCRNAGRIYELMRFFDSSAPEPERRLQGLGDVSLTTFEPGQEQLALAALIRRYGQIDRIKSLAVLWSGVDPISSTPITDLSISVAVCSPWQEEVRWQFQNASKFLSANGLSLPSQGYGWVETQLRALSNEFFPSPEDVALVRSIATSYHVNANVRSRITKTTPYKFGFHWVVMDNRVTLRRRARGPWWAGEVILHFQADDWHEGLPRPNVVRVAPFNRPQTQNTVRLYSVADFKGLEADTVVLLMRGRVTSHRNAVYVGISRARGVLAIAADVTAATEFPRSFQWDRASSAI